jgi:hypothetical protein
VPIYDQVRKLGRKAIRTDSRTLRLTEYLTPALPPAPAAVGWAHGIRQYGVLMNDNLGDCVPAAKGHAIQIFTANSSTEANITDAMALQDYEICCGYNPADPSTDQGGIILDNLNLWQKGTGGYTGHKLTAFASATVSNLVEIRQAIALFGGVYIGLNIPQYALPGDGTIPPVWDVNPNADNTIIGGHCVFICAFSPYALTAITWGQLQPMTWAFWNAFVDEAFCLISPDWIRKNGGAPNGFNLAALESDLAKIV